MEFLETIPKTHACLQIAITNEDVEFRDLLKSKVEEHNHDVLHNPLPNAGFDLFFPEDVTFDSIKTKLVSMDIKAQMLFYNPSNEGWNYCNYYLYPRSSISKTPLLLANHVGIIYSGYRGKIMGGFRNLSISEFQVNKHNRLLQICSGDLRPIVVQIVDEAQLENSIRQEGGFGSTGR